MSLAMVAHPESRPPPPTGAISASSGPVSSSSSNAAVPCPAMIMGWSKGGTRVAPLSF